MKVVKFLVRIIALGAVTAAFFGVPFCWLAVKAQSLICGIVVTLLLGRFFCDAMCPLGIVQSLVGWIRHPKKHVRRVCSRLPESNLQMTVRWVVVAAVIGLCAADYAGIATMIEPISIYGKAVTLWMPGVIIFAIVIGLSLVGNGRIWCNWVCPFGTIYNLMSKMSIGRNKIGKGCGNCRRCFEKEAKDAEEAYESEGLTRRESLKGLALIAATEKLTDGGFAEVSLPGVPDRESTVLPPGATSRRLFSLKCVGCQLCVANCPGKCLKPSTKLNTFGQPVMDFVHGYCLLGCSKCSEICPEGAIQFTQREQRPNVHMGHAIWNQAACIRTTTKDPCTACVRKCPVQAIHLVKGFPVVDKDKCIGCGACEHVCPARPQPAIYVKGFEMQRIVNPISEADLLVEMKSKITEGASVVVAKGGVIIAIENGRGISPLLTLHDEGKLRDAVVMDKVIGRAAAAICVNGGAVKVHTMLAAKGAVDIFKQAEIPFTAEKVVDTILNREQTGSCPMERAVAELEDPNKMINAIRKVMKK